MSDFYTNVAYIKGKILYRGYSGDKKVYIKHPVEPEYFIRTDNPNSGYKSLDGYSIEKKTFANTSEAYKWNASRADLDNFSVYGTNNYTQLYMSKLPDDGHDISKVDTGIIDIETDFNNGFPDPTKADQEILAITYMSSKDSIYHCWGCGDYDASKSILEDIDIVYHKHNNEVELLEAFINHFSHLDNCPDIITGWNVEGFDIPYILNRTYNILGKAWVYKLSPWGIIDAKEVLDSYQKTRIQLKLLGITTLDYLDLFKKYSYMGEQESYKLDHIGYVVTGDKKVTYSDYGSLKDLYKNDYQRYIDYNIKDVQLVKNIDKKLNLIKLVCAMSYKSKSNYYDCLGTLKIWENVIFNELHRNNIMPEIVKKKAVKGDLKGAFVKEPKIGMHDWVVSFDLSSLYPNLMVQYNCSPETLVNCDYPNDDEYYLNNTDKISTEYSVAANGATYTKAKRGVIPSIICDYYAERKSIKKKIHENDLIINKSTDTALIDKLQAENSLLHINQMSIKIAINSLYGAIGNPYFRYNNIIIANSITATGRVTIRTIIKEINNFFRNILGSDYKDYDFIIASDTDSVYIDFKPMIYKYAPKNPIGFIDDICSKHLETYISDKFLELHERMNAYDFRMEMPREKIASRAVWVAKKNYLLNVIESDGIVYSTPKLTVKGVEAVKASTPEICRNKLKECIYTIMNSDEQTLQTIIKDFNVVFNSSSPREIGCPTSVNYIDKYICGSEEMYTKGTPINSKAAIVYNRLLVRLGLDLNYTPISQSDKIRYCYLITPNPIQQNVIGFMDELPKEFNLHKYIDYSVQFNKTFLKPIIRILDVIGWSWEQQNDISDIFS